MRKTGYCHESQNIDGAIQGKPNSKGYPKAAPKLQAPSPWISGLLEARIRVDP
jgi:hypothetical protein